MAVYKSRRGPNNLTLRTTNAWKDRIHHFILPQVFREHMTRTNQAIYYDAQLLDSPGFKFCSSRTQVQPYACLDFWTHVAPICHKSNPLCRGVDRVFQHALARHRSLQQQYSNMSLDLVVLESQDDHSKPALSFQGRKFFDIVVITRVRNCSTAQGSSHHQQNGCATVAIDDYRYEGASITSSVTNWYYIVAALRMVGQSYAWLRLSMLFLGCFFARAAEPQYANARLLSRLRAGLRTTFLVPSQVAIYGNVIPITCYVTAHLLDSATVYELVAQTFSSPLGVFKLNLREFLQLSAVSMRSVWVLAFLLHVRLYVRTQRTWAAANGISGIPEFSITFVSCLTIMAQFRSVAFRDAQVLSISEVVHSARVASIRTSAYDNSPSFWRLVFLGNTLDAKCLLGSAIILSALLLVAWCWLQALGKLRIAKRIYMFVWPETRVSGGTGPGTSIIRRYTQFREKMSVLPMEGSSSSFTAKHRANRVNVSPLHIQEASRLLRHDFAILDERRNEVESMIYLMNLAVMTDPVVLLRVWWSKGMKVGVYQSKATRKLFLIPQQAVCSQRDVPIVWDDYDLLLKVSTKDLSWQDLLHCG